jgi:hypothetical protein
LRDQVVTAGGQYTPLLVERFAHEPAGHFRDLVGLLLGQLVVCGDYAERPLEPDPPAAAWVPAPVFAGAVDDERDEPGQD